MKKHTQILRSLLQFRKNIALLIFVVAVTTLGTSSCGSKQEKEETGPEQTTIVEEEVNQKPRLLILTDIGGDPDDQQSMVRLSLYLNEFELEGFIASASGTPGELDEAIVQPHLIEEIIQAYGEVRPNLLLHDENYPETEELLSKIKTGNPNRGISYIGEGQDTEGSEWIIQAADKEDERPLNIAIWGGQTDLFQALWKVKNTRSQEAYQKFISRLRIYDIADQDNIFDQVSQQFPGLFYILNKAQKGEDKRNAVFRGMYLGGNESLTSLEWIKANVQQDHGPLGALYPLETWTAPNPHGVMKEGDSPSWLYFLPTGLSSPDHPEWGGWGGRFTPTDSIFIDAADKIGNEINARATVWRWRPHFQNEFQARMDWCVKSYEEANHNPVAAFDGDKSKNIIKITASPGTEVSLSAAGSSDPDGDGLSFHWYVYEDAGTYKTAVTINGAEAQEARLLIPEDAGNGQTIHTILELRDNGYPELYSYKRVIIIVN